MTIKQKIYYRAIVLSAYLIIMALAGYFMSSHVTEDAAHSIGSVALVALLAMTFLDWRFWDKVMLKIGLILLGGAPFAAGHHVGLYPDDPFNVMLLFSGLGALLLLTGFAFLSNKALRSLGNSK